MGRNTVLLAALSAAGLWAPRATQAAGSRPVGKRVAIGMVQVDVAKRRCSFETEVCLREGALEFLVVGWQTKTHESILHTKAKASHLHAGLLLLGLTPGKPARWSGQEEGARFLPPAGAGLKMELAWKDKNGKAHRVDAGAWLKAGGEKQFTPPKEWIFVGSEVLPDGRYWAELDGEVVSVTNFASAVIDVPFRSSNVDAMRDLFANPAAIPPVGTKVEVILTALPGAEKALDARKMLEIDRFGQMRIDGKELHGEKLQEWAAKYIERHERGQVVLRAAARALMHDVETARTDLRLGGVREFHVQRVPARGEVLPRTPQQAQRALTQWRHKFAHAEEYIHEPGRQARRLLDQIELELRRRQAQTNMLKEYAAHLRQELGRYKVSTQPAGGPGGRE